MERFWEKVNITGLYSCWEWEAYISPAGYGQFQLEGRAQPAHRVAYSLVAGRVPEGYHVHHKCENAACVNFLHLEAISPADHNREHKVKEICIRGHARVGNNLNGRQCVTCVNKTSRRHYEANREQILVRQIKRNAALKEEKVAYDRARYRACKRASNRHHAKGNPK